YTLMHQKNAHIWAKIELAIANSKPKKTSPEVLISISRTSGFSITIITYKYGFVNRKIEKNQICIHAQKRMLIIVHYVHGLL
ncbi:MAG: hypothetical protein U0L42_00075, partial [Methanobrevibacter sp.]|uniref:hypothetical protein n=1 Tax=Methanobrevibacter sp. TaxID=66852 RepID=UPI002E760617